MTAPRLWVAAVSAALLSGCVAPALDSGAFTANGAAALGSALSETRTTALVVQSRLDGRVTHQVADVVVTDSEDALGPIQASFANVDAPSRADDALREKVTTLLDASEAAVTAARIAVRREDRKAMAAAVSRLNQVATRLETAEQDLS